jgi:alpha-glucuronidase
MIDRWTRLTWGNDPEVVRTVSAIELKSWSFYEGYTALHGMGTLTNILSYHFGRASRVPNETVGVSDSAA